MGFFRRNSRNPDMEPARGAMPIDLGRYLVMVAEGTFPGLVRDGGYEVMHRPSMKTAQLVWSGMKWRPTVKQRTPSKSSKKSVAGNRNRSPKCSLMMEFAVGRHSNETSFGPLSSTYPQSIGAASRRQDTSVAAGFPPDTEGDDLTDKYR
jgi:hypothetical protein